MILALSHTKLLSPKPFFLKGLACGCVPANSPLNPTLLHQNKHAGFGFLERFRASAHGVGLVGVQGLPGARDARSHYLTLIPGVGMPADLIPCIPCPRLADSPSPPEVK